jgi:hypothetical protein
VSFALFFTNIRIGSVQRSWTNRLCSMPAERPRLFSVEQIGARLRESGRPFNRAILAGVRDRWSM